VSTLVVKFPNRKRHDPCHTSLTPVLLFQRIRIYLCSFLPPIYGWYLYYLYSVMMSIRLANQIGVCRHILQTLVMQKRSH